MNILVTGGAGYIGSHTCVELLEVGYQVTVVDSLSNSKQAALRWVSEITGCKPDFVHADLRDRMALVALFRDRSFAAVVHFAGFKAVGESIQIPLAYYENNIGGTLALYQAMAEAGVSHGLAFRLRRRSHAPHSDQMLSPAPTRGTSHSARRLRSLVSLCSSDDLMRRCCLIHLRNNSTCRRYR